MLRKKYSHRVKKENVSIHIYIYILSGFSTTRIHKMHLTRSKRLKKKHCEILIVNMS